MNTPTEEMHLIFVLGMHRSGTSVLSRSLRTLGVEVGHEPDQSGAADNPKGFWEAPEFVQLNDRILQRLGLTWDSTRPIPPSVWACPQLADLRVAAKALLTAVSGEHGRYAVKDPRFCLTLPLWAKSARELKLKTSFVLSLRHPANIAASLQAREYFQHEKSYLLSTTYLTAALRSTQKQPLCIVQYDALLEQPEQQLTRLAGLLALEKGPIPEELRAFRDDFLEPGLRHNRVEASPQPAVAESEAEKLALELYALLREHAAAGELERSPEFNRRVRAIHDRFVNLSFCGNNDRRGLQERLAAAAASVETLKRSTLDYRSGAVALFERVSSLDGTVWERAHQVAWLNQEVLRLRVEKARLAQAAFAQTQSLLSEARLIIARERISVLTSLRRWLYYFLRQPERPWVPTGLRDYARQRADELDRNTLLRQPTSPALDADAAAPALPEQPPRPEPTDSAAPLQFEPPREPLPEPPLLVVLPVMNWEGQRPRSRKLLQAFGSLGYSTVYVAPYFADIRENRAWSLQRLDLENAWLCQLACIAPTPNIYSGEASDAQIQQLTLALSALLEKSGAKTFAFFCEAPFWYRILASFPTCAVVAGALDPTLELALGAHEVDQRLTNLFRGTDVLVTSTPDASRRAERIAANLCIEDEEPDRDWTASATRILDAIDARRPPVSIVVLCYNNLDLTKACIDSVARHSEYPDLELILVDNASSDGTAAYLESLDLPGIKLKTIRNESNLGFAGGNNVGLQAATGDYLVLLNNDTVVTPGWLHNLLRPLLFAPNIGAIGPVSNAVGNEACISIHYEDMERMFLAAAAYTSSHYQQIETIDTLGFFCMLFPRAVYEKVGALNERYGVGMFEDADYCERITQAGFTLVITHGAFVHHHQSATFSQMAAERKQRLFEKNKKIYEQTWGRWHIPAKRPLKDFEL